MIDQLRIVLFDAGIILMKYFYQENEVSLKQDSSPVTQADIEVSDFLIQALQEYFPDDVFLSEEAMMDIDWKKRVRVIDPLDGTAMFLNKVPTFSIMIACIEKGRPIFSAVYYPVS